MAEFGDEGIDGFFGEVLHHYDVGELAAEAGVLVLRQLVLVGQFWRRTAHEDGVAVFVHPRGIACVVEPLQTSSLFPCHMMAPTVLLGF